MKGGAHLQLLLLPVLILTVLMPSSTCQCTQCIQLQAFSCKICYDNCTQNQTQQLQTCDYTYCSEYSYDENGTSSCSGYETKAVPQSQCFHQCCSSDQTYFSVEELNRCDAESKKRMTIIIAVTCSVFGVIVIIFLICSGLMHKFLNCIADCCGSICHCLANCCGCLGDCLRSLCRCQCLIRSESNQQQVNQMNNSIDLMEKKKWEEQEKPNENLQTEDTICSICLGNRVDTVSKCGHCFHIGCIAQWFRKSPHCPVCRDQHVNSVQFYCRGCCRRFIRFDLAVNRSITQSINQVKGPNCSVCQ